MDHGAIRSRMHTVVAVPVAPFGEQEAIDTDAYINLLRRLESAGIQVVTPNGNTGEFYALSPEEWETLTRQALETVGHEVLVMPGIGHSIGVAIAMARYARGLGIQAVMVHQPVHPFHSADGWIAYHHEIADAVPEVAIVPYIRDATISSDMIAELASCCANVVAVKYAVPDPVQFASIVREVGADRLAFVCGLAELWAPFFWVGGAIGFTSGLANAAPELSLQMLRCLQEGNDEGAMRVWTCVAPFERLRARDSSANNVSVIKEALCQMGICGRAVRPPSSELSEPEREEVRSILQAWRVPTLQATVNP